MGTVKLAILAFFLAVILLLQIVFLSYQNFSPGSREVGGFSFSEFANLFGLKDYRNMALMMDTEDLSYLFRNNPGVNFDERGNMKVVNKSPKDWVEYNSGSIVMDCPFKLMAGFANTGDRSSVTFSSSLSRGRDWWRDLRRIYIHQDAEGALLLEIRDGRSLDSTRFYALETPGQTLILNFLDPFGKELEVTDGGGKVLEKIDFPSLEDMEFPFGFLPERKGYVGLSVSPESTIRVKNLFLMKKEGIGCVN